MVRPNVYITFLSIHARHKARKAPQQTAHGRLRSSVALSGIGPGLLPCSHNDRSNGR